jgi:hypothetical protein
MPILDIKLEPNYWILKKIHTKKDIDQLRQLFYQPVLSALTFNIIKYKLFLKIYMFNHFQEMLWLPL